jgi:hypothetical protein
MGTRDSCGFPDQINAIVGSDLPDIEKLKRCFGLVTGRIVDQADRDIELARATHDREERVKLQIKRSSIKTAREILSTWYTRITGRSAWDE